MGQGKIYIASLGTVIFGRRCYFAYGLPGIYIGILLHSDLCKLSVGGLIAIAQIQCYCLADLFIFEIEVTLPCAQAVTASPSSAEKIVAGLYLY